MWGPTDVYGIRQPIGGDAQLLVMGQSIDRASSFDEKDIFYGMRETDDQIAKTAAPSENNVYNPNEPMPPIVWTKSYQLPNGKLGQSLTSTIGAAPDMVDEDVRRMYVNAVYHLLGSTVPKRANVDLVGVYQPMGFGFHTDEYWQQKQLKVIDFQ